MSNHRFTSESVSDGHPDKICDAISDAVLDACLAGDPLSRVACEALCKTGLVVVAGEITTRAAVDVAAIARRTVREIGYDRAEAGFDADSCAVLAAIEPQSRDISQGVTEGEGAFTEPGAGDQGSMFGFAVDETPELMPAPLMYAHRLMRRMAEVRRANPDGMFLPDAKSQVTVEYDAQRRPLRIDTVVVSTQHTPDADDARLHEAVIELVIRPTLPPQLIDGRTRFLINPTGRFVIGGPRGDAGLTGRKIIVDAYGGMGRHGGGAFSGKDPTKVDRSAAYFARYLAKNLVAAGLARRAEVQLAYAIGVARPVSVHVDTFGTGVVSDEALMACLVEQFDLRPRAIIERLDLRRPIYHPTAAYGHFGRAEFSWEKTDAAELLADAFERPLRGRAHAGADRQAALSDH